MAFPLRSSFFLSLLSLLMGGAEVALADHQPVLVVPGRPGVPVMIDGYDATGAVVYGDVGLYRPGHVYPAIQGPALIGHTYGPGRYFPSAGRPPRLGRSESALPRRGGSPADRDYSRFWSTRSEPRPVTEYPPIDPPDVILAPRERPRVRSRH